MNVRRPFSMDLVYPIAELVPFIGRKKNPAQRDAAIPVRQLKRNMEQAKSPKGEEASAKLGGLETETSTPRKELTSSATTMRSKSMGQAKPIFQARRRTRGSSQNNSTTERTVTSLSQVGTRRKQVTKKKNG